MVYVKYFDIWNKIKKEIDSKEKRMEFVPGEIFWCNVGVNISSEMDGKGEGFSRPVLILGNFKQNLLFVLPITTGHKEGKWHFHYKMKDREVSVCLHQAKTVSKNRMGEKMEQIPSNKLKEIKTAFVKFYSL